MGKSWHCIWNKLGQVCGGLKITDKDIALGCWLTSSCSLLFFSRISDFALCFPRFQYWPTILPRVQSVIFPFIHRRHWACVVVLPVSLLCMSKSGWRQRQAGRKKGKLVFVCATVCRKIEIISIEMNLFLSFKLTFSCKLLSLGGDACERSRGPLISAAARENHKPV